MDNQESTLLDAVKKAAAKQDYPAYKQALYKLAEYYVLQSKCAKSAGEKLRYDRKYEPVYKLLEEEIKREKAEAAKQPKPKEAPESGKGSPSQKTQNEDDGLTKFVTIERPTIKFEHIAGMEKVKEDIRLRMIEPFEEKLAASKYGVQTGGGMLLFGPPGTGKTTIVKAMAGQIGAQLFAIKSSDLVSKWVGDSERNVRKLFESIDKEKRTILFFDDMESIFKERGTDIHGDKLFAELIQHMDGIGGRNPNLLLVGATNVPWILDVAATRPGRFEQFVYIPLPDDDARRFFFNRALKNVEAKSEDIDMAELVARSEDYSGADIETLCNEASKMIFRDYLKQNRGSNAPKVYPPLQMKHFLEAFEEVKPSVTMQVLLRFEQFRAERGLI